MIESVCIPRPTICSLPLVASREHPALAIRSHCQGLGTAPVFANTQLSLAPVLFFCMNFLIYFHADFFLFVFFVSRTTRVPSAKS